MERLDVCTQKYTSVMSDDEQLRWVKVPKGTVLSGSKGTPGYERDLLRERGTNKLLGPAESRPADLEQLRGLDDRDTDMFDGYSAPARVTESASFPEQLVRAIMEGIVEGISSALEDPEVRRNLVMVAGRAGRSVKKFLSDNLFPRRIPRHVDGDAGASRDDGADGVVTDELSVRQPEPDLAKGDSQIGTAVGYATSAMSGDEFRARLLAALAAEEFAVEQRRLLATVHVEDNDLPTELKDAIQSALEGRADALDSQTLALVVAFLGGAQVADSEFVLVRSAEVEPLPLPVMRPR